MNEENLASGENILIGQSEKTGFHLSVQTIVSLSAPLPKDIDMEIAQFWQQRRVVFSEISKHTMYGHRGSLWWNAITFDMSKLRSDLTVHLLQETGKVECVLDVKTTLQKITPMNRRYWVEEMIAFESYMQSKDDKPNDWSEFLQEYRKDNKRWVWGIAITVSVAMIVSHVVGGFLSWLLGLVTSSR